MSFFQNFFNFSLNKFLKNPWQDFGAPVRAAPGGRCPPPCPPLATPLTLRSSVCTIPGSMPGPRSRMPQHHHRGWSTTPDEAYSTHQTLSNSPATAGCYKEGDAPGCHQGSQQPNRVLHNRPPPISSDEDTFRRVQRTTLSQLRSGHCRLLNSYQNRLKPTVDTKCPDCGVNPHDVPHLFNCTG